MNHSLYPICIVMWKTWPTRSHRSYHVQKVQFRIGAKVFLLRLIILLLDLTKFPLFSPPSLSHPIHPLFSFHFLSFASMPCCFGLTNCTFSLVTCDQWPLKSRWRMMWSSFILKRKASDPASASFFASIAHFIPIPINNGIHARERKRSDRTEELEEGWSRFMHLNKLGLYFLPFFHLSFIAWMWMLCVTRSNEKQSLSLSASLSPFRMSFRSFFARSLWKHNFTFLIVASRMMFHISTDDEFTIWCLLHSFRYHSFLWN